MIRQILAPIGLILFIALPSAAKPPNIVHILVDDLGWQDVACYRRDYTDDEPLYETPNMDRIAARGIRFMQAYSPSVTCAPSRTASSLEAFSY